MGPVCSNRPSIRLLSQQFQNAHSHETTGESAYEILEGTGISISTEGKTYLGGALGSTPFITQFMERKVQGWIDELNTLRAIAETQPLELCSSCHRP